MVLSDSARSLSYSESGDWLLRETSGGLVSFFPVPEIPMSNYSSSSTNRVDVITGDVINLNMQNNIWCDSGHQMKTVELQFTF